MIFKIAPIKINCNTYTNGFFPTPARFSPLLFELSLTHSATVCIKSPSEFIQEEASKSSFTAGWMRVYKSSSNHNDKQKQVQVNLCSS